MAVENDTTLKAASPVVQEKAENKEPVKEEQKVQEQPKTQEQPKAQEQPKVQEKPKEKPKKLSKGERKKLRVITKLIDGEFNGTEAAKKLGITTRQVRNLKRQVLEEGRDGVIHKNKNYKPYNTYDDEISTFICKLYRKSYRGTNFSEYARIIQEEYGILASRSTIYNFLRRGHIRSPQRKAKKKRVAVIDEFGNKTYKIVRVETRKPINNSAKKSTKKTTTKKTTTAKKASTTKKTTSK